MYFLIYTFKTINLNIFIQQWKLKGRIKYSYKIHLFHRFQKIHDMTLMKGVMFLRQLLGRSCQSIMFRLKFTFCDTRFTEAEEVIRSFLFTHRSTRIFDIFSAEPKNIFIRIALKWFCYGSSCVTYMNVKIDCKVLG